MRVRVQLAGRHQQRVGVGLHGIRPIRGSADNHFWPLYTGTPIPEGSWRDRMWLDTWI
ncbi:hypothetical protein [Streptomyces sp. AC154]|uniref:hypothetical protein n=1 Tax=Streptomyces sp. AC154 TaxID=3143184 RepID=UPI003F7F27BC